MDWEMPSVVTATGTTMANGINPLAVVATMQFEADGGCLATMDCGFDVENREHLEVAGTDGSVRVDGFVLVGTPPWATPSPSTADANAFRIASGINRTIDGQPTGQRTTTYERNEVVATEMPLSQEAEMVVKLSALAAGGAATLEGCWPQYMLDTQRVLDAVLKSFRAGGQPMVP